MQTRFILVWPLPVPTSNPQAIHLRFFHYLCKSFTYFEHTLGSLTLVFKDSPRDNPSLDYNSHNPRDNQSLDYN